MSTLRTFKKIYNYLGKNKTIRGYALKTADNLNIRKNIVRMDVNNFCNVRCVFCSQFRQENIHKSNIMSVGDFKKIIDKIHRQTRFLYMSCGYEPLAVPNFAEYLEYAKSKKIPFISFVTNGLLLKEKIIKSAVDNQIDEIAISFNGFNKEDYNRLMFKSDYDTVISNIKRLNEYKAEMNSVYPKIRLNCILMKSNIKDFDRVIDFLDENKISVLNFRRLGVYEGQNDSDAVKTEIVEFTPPDKEASEFIKKYKAYINGRKNSGVEFIAPNMLVKENVPNISAGGYYRRKKGNAYFRCFRTG
ncbi:MAG: radical SAM protein [Oscillospiraceae bacterium]|nr:radical SAM protein [Oscillospiraceae bacterium]